MAGHFHQCEQCVAVTLALAPMRMCLPIPEQLLAFISVYGECTLFECIYFILVFKSQRTFCKCI